jgi:uncharacterized protein (DUF2141 family)
MVPAALGATELVFRDVQPGRYAVQMFHDENDDGRLNENILGIPTEGIGFSRDAPVLGTPKFADAAIDVPKDGLTIRVTMRYSILD